MRSRARLIWVFTLLVSPIGGCNEVTDPTTARLILTITGVGLQGERRGPLENVQLCETGTTNCGLSNDKGEVTIDLPIGETSYTLQKEEYGSYLVGDVMGPNGEEYSLGMSLEQGFVEQHERVMSPWPMRGTGTILLQVNPWFGGATFKLFGATGPGYYVHESGDWRSDLTVTTRQGAGGFVEVGRGDFRVELGGTAKGCIPDLGWPGDVQNNSVRFPVREGYVTLVGVICSIPSTTTVLVRTIEAVPGSIVHTGGPPLEGVEVCQTGTSDCVTTDAYGEARLTQPGNQVFSRTLSKEGYVPYLMAGVTDNMSRVTPRLPMISHAQMEDISQDLMIPPYPSWTGGWVRLRAWSDNNEAAAQTGITYDLVGGTAKQYYVDEDGSPTLGLTATTKWGVGGFLEVAPGEHQFDFGGTATNCVPEGWPADVADRIKLPVRTGYITLGAMTGCEEPPLP